MANKDSKVILIFVKNPVKGYVKTRFTKSIGDTKALQVYQSLLQITKGLTRELSCDRQVWYSQSVEKTIFGKMVITQSLYSMEKIWESV